MALFSLKKKKQKNIKKWALISTLSGALYFSAAHNVTAQLSEIEDTDIIDIMLPILASLNRQCSSPTILNIIGASDDGNFDIEDSVTPNIPFSPSNAIDGDPSSISRWSSNSGSPITFELAANSTVTDLSISWFGSERENRIAFFEIETSLDGVVWQTVLSDGESVMTSNAGDFQAHDVTDSNARYVRIVGMGNSQNAFNSCLLYTSPSPRDLSTSRMPSSA